MAMCPIYPHETLWQVCSAAAAAVAAVVAAVVATLASQFLCMLYYSAGSWYSTWIEGLVAVWAIPCHMSRIHLSTDVKNCFTIHPISVVERYM